jgi:hypothetical protein
MRLLFNLLFKIKPAMKTMYRFILVLMLLASYTCSQAQKTYVLIPKKTGKLNKTLVVSLPPSLKALAALYSAMGGTNCLDLQCELTSALQLGKQGSDAQKLMIQKYFPDDKAAKLVIGQDCYLPPVGSVSFSNYGALKFTVNGDSVRVDYQLDICDHGKTKTINGPDLYIFKNQVFKNIKRVLYAWTDK